MPFGPLVDALDPGRRTRWRRSKSKLVRGENVAQTYQFVLTGNAQLGFVALAQVRPGAQWFALGAAAGFVRSDPSRRLLCSHAVPTILPPWH